jgi:hypothetical protein
MNTLLRVLAVLTWSASSVAVADTVRLSVGDRLERFDLLKPAVHRYVRYSVGVDGSRKVIDIWQRTMTIEKPADGGAPALHIAQRWDEADGKVVLIQDSWFERDTFRASTHVRHVERDGKTQIGGYRFGDREVVGMQELADNARKDFVKPLPQPSYNFETDMEFLQTLPLAEGRTFDIPFYDAGVDEPGRYPFVVAGSARVPGPDGRPVDCWLVTADYNTGKVVNRFWIAKSTQVLIREEGALADGGTIVKALLPVESGDGPTD